MTSHWVLFYTNLQVSIVLSLRASSRESVAIFGCPDYVPLATQNKWTSVSCLTSCVFSMYHVLRMSVARVNIWLISNQITSRV
ncbi:hypothetical protein KP509_31G070700 [Ceratopteris richardii]|uniref:Secreted protein n=1 Tax=Ceratopteris richardii TaxID=49495 RepID=A0A8T2R191_CERRI|nr:hypothetical protein KP509_31G070700 [Ceratopteris richardii]